MNTGAKTEALLWQRKRWEILELKHATEWGGCEPTQIWAWNLKENLRAAREKAAERKRYILFVFWNFSFLLSFCPFLSNGHEDVCFEACWYVTNIQDTEVFGVFFSTDRNSSEDCQLSTGNQNYLSPRLLSAGLDVLLIIIKTTFANHSPQILAPATHTPSQPGCCASSTNQKAFILATTAFLLPHGW